MKRKILLLNCLSVFAALILSGSAPVQAGSDVASSADRLITILNPAVATRLADRVPIAPRLDTLEGKTIYLVDDNWGGMGEKSILHDEMEAWFAEHMPGVKAVFKQISSVYTRDDPKTWEEIKANGDAAIIGVGH